MGDSVTDFGRARPVAEGLFNPLGTGYPNIVNGFIQAHYPEKYIHCINMGSGGDTIRAVKARWQTDAIAQKPDFISLMIGINDVWRQFDVPDMPEACVLPDEYESTLDELVKTTLPALKDGMMIMTPYYIEDNPQDKMRARMDEYGAICRKIAAKYNTLFVDTQAAFNEVLKYHHSSYFAWDRVHPNIPGAHVIARAYLNALGFKWK